jgi:hypothetical protein
MKFVRFARLFALLLPLLLPLRVWSREENWQQIRFREVDTVFADPGQGWMSRRFPSSVLYLRFDWADAEPEDGSFNWKLIDDAIATAKARGASVAMRVMTANAHTRGYYCSPKWLFDLGCKGFEYTAGGEDPTSGGRRIPRIEPDYSDPIYLAKHGAFMAEVGKRYDGDQHVEFLDIGSYGIWGEWHSSHPASIAVRQQIVDMYLQAFHKTRLVFMSDDAEVMSYALAHGTGFRRDGVGSPWHEQNWIGSPRYAGVQGMADTWTRAPIVFEWFGNYDYMKSKGWSFEAAVNFMLNNHVSLINDNLGQVPPEAMPQIQKLARLAGYRFVLREVGLQKTVARGANLQVIMKWENVGVARLYDASELQLSLQNPAGHAFVTTVVKTNPSAWLPGEQNIAAQLAIPSSLATGAYILAIALLDTDRGRQPLPVAIDVAPQAGWYPASRLTID